MAKQKGIIKLRGTVGDITFYKTKDGHLAREKGGVDGNRIANDPAYKRTRENGSEFGRAGKSGKVLRAAFRGILLKSADPRMTSRLTQQMVKVLQADATSVRGERNVIDGEAELLQGFEFNNRAALGGILFAPIVSTIDRVAGEITVEIASFIPSNMVMAPGGATHYKIVSAGAEIDFTNETLVVDTSETVPLPWNIASSVALSQTNTVPANSPHPLFLVIGIEFYQQVNGEMYPLNNGAFNGFSIVKVNGI